jgi:hypothetical protein
MDPRRTFGLAALALVLTGAARGAGDGKEVPPVPPPSVALTVLAGRASLVQGEVVCTLTRASGRRMVRGDAYVELGPGGELELSWPGSATVRAKGPAALEWEPKERVHVLRAERVEAEVRRGTRTLALPLEWEARVTRAAISVRELATGELLVEHRGGEPVVLTRASETPFKLAGGRTLRLTGKTDEPDAR